MNKPINFECKDHKLDYRIACEECNERWSTFTKINDAIVEDNNQDENEEII